MSSFAQIIGKATYIEHQASLKAAKLNRYGQSGDSALRHSHDNRAYQHCVGPQQAPDLPLFVPIHRFSIILDTP